MDRVTRARRNTRLSIGKVIKELEDELKKENSSATELQIALKDLEQLRDEIVQQDQEILNLLLDDPATSEENMQAESAGAMEWIRKIRRIMFEVEKSLTTASASVSVGD